MKTTQTAFILFISIFCYDVSSSHAYTRQEVINALTQAGHAYWEQKVVIEHTSTGKTFFGFSGQQTIKEEGVPRYYATDVIFVPDPHIFVESEDSKGPAGILFAYVKAYEATGNKFFLRAAKSLGDTFIQAQVDNNTGGWWHDMGVMADGVDHGKFVNYFPFGESANADPEYQHIGDNDGASYLQATALLRLEQALPAGDPDKGGKYLASAKWYADTLVALKDVTLVRGGATYHPYGNGGIPQMFPFATLTDGRRPVDFCKNCSFPDDYPEGFQEYSHNIMITLNDDAMLGAVLFLGEFALEAKTNAGLDEMTYLNAGRLNIDYLLDRFTALAAPSGYSAWATAYYIQDGSANADKPAWLRSMEPPGFYAQSSADDILVYWYKNVETDPARLATINSTMAQHALFWKNDAKAVNGDQQYVDIVAGDYTGVDAGTDPVLTGPAKQWTKADAHYDPDNPNTWYFWYVVNHDPATGNIGLPVSGPYPLECKEKGDNCYNRTVGLPAVYRRNLTNGDFYSYQESGYPPLIGESQGTSSPSHEIAVLLDEANNGYHWDHFNLEHYHSYDPDRRFFYRQEHSSARITGLSGALDNLDEETKFFETSTVVIDHISYPVTVDDFFTERMSCLAWGIDHGGTGEIVDSDGDGYSDEEETTAGTDSSDSESIPGTTQPGTLIPQYLLLLKQ